MAIAVLIAVVFSSLFFGGIGFVLTGNVVVGLVMFGVSCLLYGTIIGACIAGSDDLDL